MGTDDAIPDRQPWTSADERLLRQRYADTRTADLAAALGRPVARVYAKAHNLGLKKGPQFLATDASGRILKGGKLGQATQFKPGQKPWSTGTKGVVGVQEGCRRTQFKPGHAHNTQPVGTLRINADGYLDRKVSATGYGPRDWQPVHRLVWQAAHGPIPAGHAVVFKPGRRTTDANLITLDAIELITRQELMRRNSVHQLPPELVEVVQLRGVLTRRINQRAKANSQPKTETEGRSVP